jgi:hypothetical protein
LRKYNIGFVRSQAVNDKGKSWKPCMSESPTIIKLEMEDLTAGFIFIYAFLVIINQHFKKDLIYYISYIIGIVVITLLIVQLFS